MRLTASEDSPFKLIPDGTIVEAVFRGAEMKEMTWTSKDTGLEETRERIKWTFQVTQPGEFNGFTVTSLTSNVFSLNENCKAMNYFIALAGAAPSPGEEVDVEDLIGAPCKVVVTISTDGKWNNVDDVIPASARRSAGEVFG